MSQQPAAPGPGNANVAGVDPEIELASEDTEDLAGIRANNRGHNTGSVARHEVHLAQAKEPGSPGHFTLEGQGDRSV